MGSVISVFDDFMAATDSSYLTDAKGVINEVVQNTYALGYMLKSGQTGMSLQGGKSIKWFAQFRDAATAHFYLPDDTESPAQPQTLTSMEASWRFLRDSIAWNNETVALNASQMDPNGRRTQIIDLKHQYEQAMWTSKINKMEAACWDTPVKADMETAATAKVPYSIPVFVNELSNGDPYIGLATTTTWDSVCGVNPDTEAKWRNQGAAYDGAKIGAIDAATHLFVAMRKVFNKCGFDRLPMKPEYSEKRSTPTRILCSLSYGQPQYEYALQGNNDFLRYTGGQDPTYPNPTFHGIPVEGIKALDTNVAYPTAASAHYSTENDPAGTTNAGPRYYFLNFEYLKAIFHTEMYMHKHPVMTHPNQPSTKVIWCDTYYNVVPVSRQRHGIVYPGTTDSVFI
jgi:hypothetical protein